MSTVPDLLRHLGGVPVGNISDYAGFWGNNVWFVDYDGGTTASQGKEVLTPAKYLDSVLSNAAAWDVIYIRPRTPDTAGGDPQAHLPVSTTANYSIPYTKHGISLIGTGFGAAKTAAYMTRIQGASGVTSSTLTIYAPYVNVENLSIRRGSSTAAGIRVEGQTSGGSGYAFGVTINKSQFWKVGSTATQAALYIESAWHTTVNECWFEECAKGVGIGVSGSNVVGTSVLNTIFSGVDTTIDADIYATSGSTISAVLIDNCRFAHDIPALSGGSYLKYIVFGTAGGLISNCNFGTETNTIATNMTISNCDIVNCTYAPGTNLTS